MPDSRVTVGTTPPTPFVNDEAGGGDVIHLSGRRHAGRREEPPMSAYGHDQDPRYALAARIEAMYLHRGRTLLDDDTAEAHRIAYDSALLLIDAVMATGDMAENVHTTLRAHFEAARNAPEDL